MSNIEREILPLLYSQRGLWVGQKVNSAVSMMLAESITLKGDVDVTLLIRASKQIAAEFETLRVRIIEDNGIPKQCIDPSYTHPIITIDASIEANPAAVVQQRITEEIGRQVDIA